MDACESEGHAVEPHDEDAEEENDQFEDDCELSPWDVS